MSFFNDYSIQIQLVINGQVMVGEEYKKYLNELYTNVEWHIKEHEMQTILYDTLKINTERGYDRIENKDGNSIGQATMRKESYYQLITGKAKSLKNQEYIRQRYLLTTSN